MRTTKCQWINAVILCALALTQPMRVQSSNVADSLAVRATTVSAKPADQAPLKTTSSENASEAKTNPTPKSAVPKTSSKASTPTPTSSAPAAKASSQSPTSTSAPAVPTTKTSAPAVPTTKTSAPTAKTPTGAASTQKADTTAVATDPVSPTPKASSTSAPTSAPVKSSSKPNTAATSTAESTAPKATSTAAKTTIPATTPTAKVEPQSITTTNVSASVETQPSASSKADSVAVVTLIEGQEIYDPDSIITKIDIRMVEMDSLIHKTSRNFNSPEFLRWRASYTTDSLYLATLDKIAQTQASIIKAQSGIQLTGQTYYRPDAAFGIDEDTDDVSRYVAKIQAEVRWYFLQSGIYNRQGRIEEINLKTDIERLEHQINRAEPQLYANRERLRVNSDSVLASIMLHRITNLEMLEQAYLYLLDNENISSDNLLRILDDRAEAERRLSTISTAPTLAPSLSYVQAGTVTIDTMAIFETIFETDLNIKILDKKSLLLDQQAANTRWLNDVRVAPFARYSHYFRHNMAVSANVDVGISFTVPINGEASRKRHALLLEKGLIDSKRDQVETSAADRVRYIVNEVYRLNRSITGEWQRALSLKKYLKSRRQAYDRRQGEYNRLSALMEYNGYLRCLENIIEIQYRRDSLLADLQSMMPETPLDRYCAFIPLYAHE